MMQMFRNGEKVLAVLLLSMDYAMYVHAGLCHKFLVPYPFPGSRNTKLHKDNFSIALKDSCNVLVDDHVEHKYNIKELLKLKPCSAIIDQGYDCWIVVQTAGNEKIVPPSALTTLDKDKKIFHFCSKANFHTDPYTDFKIPADYSLQAGVYAYANFVYTNQLTPKDQKKFDLTNGTPLAKVQCAYSNTKKEDLWLHVKCEYLGCRRP